MDLKANEAIGIAGAGRVGLALGRLLRERGEPVVAVASRHPGSASAGAAFVGEGVEAAPYSRLAEVAARIVIAVPDYAVVEVAAALARSGMSRGLALHTCGALGPEALAPLAVEGVSCAVLHPLQTIPTPEQGLSALVGIAFAIAGDAPAAEWAVQIAGTLEGEALRIPAGARPIYHAAAVMASNYLVGLVDAAVVLMGEAGVGAEQALRALAPLVKASAENALRLGPETALTGPIQRGDAGTVASHLKALEAAPAPVRELYRSAGLHTLAVARRSGLDESKARELEELMRDNGGCDG